MPYAQLLTSSLDVKSIHKENGVTFPFSPYTSAGYIATSDLQAAYQLYPGSPVSQLVSPKPRVYGTGTPLSFPDLQSPGHWSVSLSGQDTFFHKYEPSKSFNLYMEASRSFMLSQDSTESRSMSAELDHLQQACQSGGKQCSSSQEINACSDTGGNEKQNWKVESNKPDVE